MEAKSFSASHLFFFRSCKKGVQKMRFFFFASNFFIFYAIEKFCTLIQSCGSDNSNNNSQVNKKNLQKVTRGIAADLNSWRVPNN